MLQNFLLLHLTHNGDRKQCKDYKINVFKTKPTVETLINKHTFKISTAILNHTHN